MGITSLLGRMVQMVPAFTRSSHFRFKANHISNNHLSFRKELWRSSPETLVCTLRMKASQCSRAAKCDKLCHQSTSTLRCMKCNAIYSRDLALNIKSDNKAHTELCYSIKDVWIHQKHCTFSANRKQIWLFLCFCSYCELFISASFIIFLSEIAFSF